MTPAYIVFDAEYDIDRDAHYRFLDSEGYDPDGPLIKPKKEWDTPRWVFRRPVAISWMVLAPGDEGCWLPIAFGCVGKPEADEHAMLTELSKQLRHFANGTLVTWGGNNSDIQQLRLAYMRANMALPDVLHAPFTTSLRHADHWDLWERLSGKAGPIHLNEMAAALGIPAKPIGTPGSVMGNIANGKWSLVKACAEADVITTALVLMHYLNSITPGGEIAGHGNLTRICEAAIAKQHRPYAETFAAYRDVLEAQPCWADAMIAREMAAAMLAG